MEKNSLRTSTPHKAISVSTPAAMAVCVFDCVYVCACVRACVRISSWFVIFTQPYGMTAQIINYSSPVESVGVCFFLLQNAENRGFGKT